MPALLQQSHGIPLLSWSADGEWSTDLRGLVVAVRNVLNPTPPTHLLLHFHLLQAMRLHRWRKVFETLQPLPDAGVRLAFALPEPASRRDLTAFGAHLLGPVVATVEEALEHWSITPANR